MNSNFIINNKTRRKNIPEGADVGATAEEERGQKWIHRRNSKREKQSKERRLE